MARALLIGGTGPSGPDIAKALIARRYDVTVLHRGLHEPADLPEIARLEHIHADPHFKDPLVAALTNRSFELVVATYGRLRMIAQVLEQRCERFVAIAGNPVHPGMLDRRSAWPEGMKVLASETNPPLSGAKSPRDEFALKVLASEQAVLDSHARGAYAATVLRYPQIYGRRAWVHYEKGVVRRVLAGRRRLILPDGGLGITTRCADRNAAQFVAAAIDHPQRASGRVYQCGDDVQYSLIQWTQMICDCLRADVEFVSIPFDSARPVWPMISLAPHGSHHTLVDTSRARDELGYKDVVEPKQALAELVHFLAEDPARTQDAPFDPEAEDAVITAYERAHRDLAAALAWKPIDEAFKSDYDQPVKPHAPASSH